MAGKVDSRCPGGPLVDKHGYGFSEQKLNGVRIVGHIGGGDARPVDECCQREGGWCRPVMPPLPAGGRRGVPMKRRAA
jgi:hypothetical protein